MLERDSVDALANELSDRDRNFIIQTLAAHAALTQPAVSGSECLADLARRYAAFIRRAALNEPPACNICGAVPQFIVGQAEPLWNCTCRQRGEADRPSP